jgi:DNA-binding response OmpR family regulator
MADAPVLDLTRDTCVSGDEDPEWFPWLCARPRVLIVDDDEDTRAMLAQLLGRDGLAVLEAPDARSALRLAQSGKIAAVILDVRLPDGTGFEVCRMLRENPATARLRVLMLTALSGITDELTAVMAGADAYMVKPVRRDDLLRWLRNVI